MRKVLLLGYFGAGNFGDDALLCDWLARHEGFLRTHNLKVDVVAHGPRLIDGFIEQPRLAPLIGQALSREAALKVSPREYCALVAPGGSLLQDATSLRSLLYYLWLIRRFTSVQVPAYLLNQGLGPFRSWLAKHLTPQGLRACRYISCRDSESLSWASGTAHLATHPELHASADPILESRLEADAGAAVAWDLPSKYVLVLPRPTGDLPTPTDDTAEPQALAHLLRIVADQADAPVLLLPLHPVHDTKFAEETAALAPKAKVLPALPGSSRTGTAIWTALANARLVISYRLHGVIGAAAHGVPALGVAYDPKVESCCLGLGLPYCFPATVHEQAAQEDVARLLACMADARAVLEERRAQQLAKLAIAQQRYLQLWEQDCG